MPGKIVIHAGFHKTGTTTVQQVLKKNAKLLWPHMAIGLRHRFEELLHAARDYSTWRDPLSLAKFSHRFDAFIQSLDLGPKRQLVISAEELSGHLPGRGDLADYSAAPALMAEIVTVLEHRFQSPDITFYFSTRAAGPWLKSAYWEHVKASRMTLDFGDYAARYKVSADLDEAAARIAQKVAPHRVVTRSLASCADLPLGPADPLLDLLKIPAARRALLKPQPPANQARPPEVLQAFLEFNRSDMTGPEVGEAKRAYLAGLTRE